jgi:hypothetical protein
MPSFTPTYQRKRIMAGQVQVRLAPYNETTPATLPADTVELGGTWPTTPQPWTVIGATQEGVSLVFRRSTQNLTIEEQMTPVSVETTEVDVRVEAVLAEDTFETMKVAFGGGTISTQAAASGTIGKKTLVLASDLDHLALAFEGRNTFGFFRRMLVPDVVSVADIEQVNRRAASLRLYKVSFMSLVALEDMTFIEKTAAALP